MEKAGSRKKRPWYLKQQYRRIMAFMLMVAMLFADAGNYASVAYGAVAKEKVRVHAQIDSEAVVDTLVATGGYGIGFDDTIGDELMLNADSPVVGEHMYDQLLEEVTGQDRHLIAQKRVGGLGIFLIAQNQAEDFVYPDGVYLDETMTSQEVFSLFVKGEQIQDEEDQIHTMDESDREDYFGGTQEQRKTVTDLEVCTLKTIRRQALLIR